MNKFVYLEQSFFTFKAKPIMISTIPTKMFPENMESVDSISTFCSSPFVIAMTSFDASILKAPPRKNPVIPESTKQRVIQKVSEKNRTKHAQMIMQEQNRLQLFTFLLSITKHFEQFDNSSYQLLVTRAFYLQKYPRRADPNTVATLNMIGAQVE